MDFDPHESHLTQALPPMQPETEQDTKGPPKVIVESVNHLNALLAEDPLKYVFPPRGLEARFFDATPTLFRLRVLTALYGHHPATQQKAGGKTGPRAMEQRNARRR